MTVKEASKKNPAWLNLVIYILLFLILLGLYDLLAGSVFSISDKWYRIAVFFSLIAGVIGFFVDIWLIRNGKYKPDEKSSFFIKYHSLVTTPIIFALIVYTSIFISFASLYTQYKGVEYADLIPVIKTDLRSATRRTCGNYNSYKVTSTKLKTTFYNPLCISKKHYDSLKNKDFIKVTGKESFFGRTID